MPVNCRASLESTQEGCQLIARGKLSGGSRCLAVIHDTHFRSCTNSRWTLHIAAGMAVGVGSGESWHLEITREGVEKSLGNPRVRLLRSNRHP